jgi:hypothetical protein
MQIAKVPFATHSNVYVGQLERGPSAELLDGPDLSQRLTALGIDTVVDIVVAKLPPIHNCPQHDTAAFGNACRSIDKDLRYVAVHDLPNSDNYKLLARLPEIFNSICCPNTTHVGESAEESKEMEENKAENIVTREPKGVLFISTICDGAPQALAIAWTLWCSWVARNRFRIANLQSKHGSVSGSGAGECCMECAIGFPLTADCYLEVVETAWPTTGVNHGWIQQLRNLHDVMDDLVTDTTLLAPLCEQALANEKTISIDQHLYTASLIMDRLYLCGLYVSNNPEFLETSKTRLLVRLRTPAIEEDIPYRYCSSQYRNRPWETRKAISRLRIRELVVDVYDGTSPVEAPLWRSFAKIIHEIDRYRRRGMVVTVHCDKGVSRSTSCVIAYMMWLAKRDKKSLSVPDAWKAIDKVRPIINPNAGFMGQLQWWSAAVLNDGTLTVPERKLLVNNGKVLDKTIRHLAKTAAASYKTYFYDSDTEEEEGEAEEEPEWRKIAKRIALNNSPSI